MSLATLNLGKGLEPALLSGHPWIYRNHLPDHTLHSGDWVRVEAGKSVAFGLFDDDGAIGLRLFSQHDVPGDAWVTTRVDEALALRSGFDEKMTNAYRLIYGEGDFLPGITVDRYERYAVLKTYTGSVERLVPTVVKALSKQLKLRGVLSRDASGLTPLYGQKPPPEVTIVEHGLKFIANLYEGQKTGLFLDHRENRKWLEPHTSGRTVLNLFSYTGGFSLYAARGGASHVTSVDVADAANEDAKRNFALNGFDPSAHDFVTADCFELLATYAQQNRRFDVIVIDPPSLARNKKSRHAALRAYRKLNTTALTCLQPGGLLVSASCTSQVSPEEFRSVLGDAASEAKMRLQIVHDAGHASDHPVPATFPEGRYLKFVAARALPLA